MQLARVGDIAKLQKYLDNGTIDSGLMDGEGITPLHV